MNDLELMKQLLRAVGEPLSGKQLNNLVEVIKEYTKKSKEADD